jgi:hypothetical protein
MQSHTLKANLIILSLIVIYHLEQSVTYQSKYHSGFRLPLPFFVFPLISLNDDAYIYDAALVMAKYSIRRLPIIKDNVLLGIVTATDLARRLYEENRKDPCLYALARARFLEKTA